MTLGQVITITTFGVAASVAVMGVAAAGVLLFNDGVFAFLATQTAGKVPHRAILAILAAAVGIGAAYYIISFQQWVARLFVARTMRGLKRDFRLIEDAAGTEAAARWLDGRRRLLGDRALDLFGNAKP